MFKFKSFTLIETVVVIAVLGLMLPVIFSIFFVLLKEQTKVYRLSTVKKEGDYVINIIENNIKSNAVSVLSNPAVIPANEVCKAASDIYPFNGSVSNIYFVDKTGEWFGYEGANNTINTDSETGSEVNLTSAKTIISNLSFSCIRNQVYSPPSVNLSFDICFDNGIDDCNSDRPEELTSLHYQTKIKLRN